MFNQIAFQAVDGIQSAKKQFVNTFVQHEQFAKVLNNFVDAQTEYTKSAIDASIAAAISVNSIITSKNFYEDVIDSFQAFTTKTKKSK